MPSFIISCPICGKKFKLTTENSSSLIGKDFRCKNCNHNVSLAQVLHLQTSQNNTYSNITQPNNDENYLKEKPTEIVKKNILHNVILNILNTGDRIAIGEGQYTIGRRSSDSTANVQLAPDPYMSRLHAKMAAKLVGNKWIVQVCSLKSSNPVFLNGQPCLVSKPYTLRTGDKLQMGNTQIVIHLA